MADDIDYIALDNALNSRIGADELIGDTRGRYDEIVAECPRSQAKPSKTEVAFEKAWAKHHTRQGK